LVAGQAVVSGETTFAVQRFNDDGSKDPNFGNSGILLLPKSAYTSPDIVTSIKTYQGKILVAGYTLPVATAPISQVLRLNANGQLDTTFAEGGILTLDETILGNLRFRLEDMDVRADGKFIACGYFWSLGQAVAGSLISVDESGNVSILAGILATRCLYLPSGNILSAGVDGGGATLDNRSPSGTLRTEFSEDGQMTVSLGGNGGTNNISGMTIDESGNIFLAGYRQTPTENYDIVVVKMSGVGVLDTTFGVSGIAVVSLGDYDAYGKGIHINGDGKIYVTGNINNGIDLDPYIVRLDGEGAVDTTFGNQGYLTKGVGLGNETVTRSVKSSNNKIIMVGTEGPPGSYNPYVRWYWLP
jgi:uncharacterized delta-60 repeat protein